MRVDRKWMQRNLGFDPIDSPPPASTIAFATAAKSRTVEDLQREIIDFDSEAPSGLQFLAFTTATGLSRYTEITWPKGLAPRTGPTPSGQPGDPLPRADVLVVTWTVDEGHALSRVLTPGKDSRNDYVHYTHNYDTISQKMRSGCPATQAKRLGAYWTTTAPRIGACSAQTANGASHTPTAAVPIRPQRRMRRARSTASPLAVQAAGAVPIVAPSFATSAAVMAWLPRCSPRWQAGSRGCNKFRSRTLNNSFKRTCIRQAA